MVDHHIPDQLTNALYVLSQVEAKHYLYGLLSNLKGHSITRSSADIWMKLMGPEVFLDPQELAPLGLHQLDTIVWEDTVGPAMDTYLLAQEAGAVHIVVPHLYQLHW